MPTDTPGPTQPGIDAGASAHLAFPPASLFTETYLDNPEMPDYMTPILTELYSNLSAIGYQIPTFTKYQFGNEPDITEHPPWQPDDAAKFEAAIAEVQYVWPAANLDNEWIPLQLEEQLSWDDKTRNQWIAYVHGFCETFTANTTTSWGLLWKTPLTPAKRKQSWEGQALQDWISVAKPWEVIFDQFSRIGIALDTFTGSSVANEATWVNPLIENTKALFPGEPILCVVSPTTKTAGIATPTTVDESIEIVQRRFDAGADGIHLFPVARNSLRSGGAFMSKTEANEFSASCQAMIQQADDLWGSESLEGA